MVLVSFYQFKPGVAYKSAVAYIKLQITGSISAK